MILFARDVRELVYDLDYAGNGVFQGQGDRALEFRLQGSLHILILAEDSDSYRVWLRLESAGSSQLHHIPSPMKQSLQQSWMAGLSARMSQRGFFLQPLIPNDLDPIAGQFWQKLAERLQVDLPDTLPLPEWTQEEKVAGGTMLAKYAVEQSQSSSGLENEKIYLHKSFDGSPRPHLTLSGESLILLHARFEGLQQIEAQSREVQQLQGQSWVSESVLKLKWQRQNQLDESQVASIEANSKESHAKGKPSSQETSIQKVALGTLSLDQLWTLLDQSGEQISQELYLKLKAWVFLHPNDLKLLLDRLQNLKPGDAALNMSIRALAAAGHPEAQEALVGLLDQHKSDGPLARKIITTLGLVSEPTRNAQKALEQMSRAAEDDSVRRSSRLALGIMGQRLSQSQDAEASKRAQDIEGLAWENLNQASGLAAITEALAVLGNCGVSRIEDLDRWLKDPDPAVRSQAFFALRFARPPGTPLFLVESYSKDASVEVRRQILHALSLRLPDLPWFGALDVLLAQALPDEDKITIAKALLRSVKTFREESLKVMGDLLQSTQDARIRESLADYQKTAKQQGQF